MTGCPSCGLFLHHVEGCRGVIAVYMSWGQEYEEDGFMSQEEAEDFLCAGEDRGSLSSVAVRLGDGTVLHERGWVG